MNGEWVIIIAVTAVEGAEDNYSNIKYMHHKSMENTTHLSLEASLLVLHECLVLKTQEGIRVVLAWNSKAHRKVVYIMPRDPLSKGSGNYGLQIICKISGWREVVVV